MELTINIGYPQVLELVGQLPEQDIQRLAVHLQGRYAMTVKDRINQKKHTQIQELVMQAPTWTDEEYDSFLETRQHIKQSRLK